MAALARRWWEPGGWPGQQAATQGPPTPGGTAMEGEDRGQGRQAGQKGNTCWPCRPPRSRAAQAHLEDARHRLGRPRRHRVAQVHHRSAATVGATAACTLPCPPAAFSSQAVGSAGVWADTAREVQVEQACCTAANEQHPAACGARQQAPGRPAPGASGCAWRAGTRVDAGEMHAACAAVAAHGLPRRDRWLLGAVHQRHLVGRAAGGRPASHLATNKGAGVKKKCCCARLCPAGQRPWLSSRADREAAYASVCATAHQPPPDSHLQPGATRKAGGL